MKYNDKSKWKCQKMWQSLRENDRQGQENLAVVWGKYLGCPESNAFDMFH